MTGPHEGPPDRPPPAVPPALPWIQALCVVALVAVFAIDSLDHQITAPIGLYVTIGGIAVGLGPEGLKSLFKR